MEGGGEYLSLNDNFLCFLPSGNLSGKLSVFMALDNCCHLGNSVVFSRRCSPSASDYCQLS